MTRALPLSAAALMVASACGADDGTLRAQECFFINDCDGGDVCFLGRCSDPGFALGEVQLEAAPPEGSGLLDQQPVAPVDLQGEFSVIELSPTIETTAVATIGANGTLAGTVVARTPGSSSCAPRIPGRLLEFESISSVDGVLLRTPPGSYELQFEPNVIEDGGTSRALPPLGISSTDGCGVALTSGANLPIAYPALDTLVAVEGVIRGNATVATPIADAQVYGLGTLADGTRVRSTTAATDVDGHYELTFPPGIETIELFVGPGNRQDIPSVSFPDLVPSGGELPAVQLGIEASIPFEARVLARENSGALVPVPGARVLIVGTVGAGRLELSVLTDGDTGRLPESLSSLPPGAYRITVAPRLNSLYGITASEFTVASSDVESFVQVVVPKKVRVSGKIRAHDGTPVDGARVIFRSRSAPVNRQFSATSDNGEYDVEIDAPIGLETEGEWEVVVEPRVESGAPLARELVRIGHDGERVDLDLSRATIVYGRVETPTGNPLPNTLLRFYSLELAEGEEAILVGTTQSGTAGEFALPVPTPATP